MAHTGKAVFPDLQQHVDELFEELIFGRWPGLGGLGSWPPVDLHEMLDEYIVEVDLPDVAPEHVLIEVAERQLVIAGERRPTRLEGVVFEHCERRCVTFRRLLHLPQAVDVRKVEYQCRHGTYRIRLPKKRHSEKSEPQGSSEAPASPRSFRVPIR